jgi:hypothetical protein
MNSLISKHAWGACRDRPWENRHRAILCPTLGCPWLSPVGCNPLIEVLLNLLQSLHVQPANTNRNTISITNNYVNSYLQKGQFEFGDRYTI